MIDSGTAPLEPSPLLCTCRETVSPTAADEAFLRVFEVFLIFYHRSDDQKGKFHLGIYFFSRMRYAVRAKKHPAYRKGDVNMEKRLYRVREGKMIAGVCGGIAQYFGIDPTIIRLAWAIFCALGGSGVLAYIIAAIIIPEEP